MGCATSTSIVVPVREQTRDTPESTGQKDDRCRREADYDPPVGTLTRSASSTSVRSIGEGSFSLSSRSDLSLNTTKSDTLDATKWAAARTYIRGPPPRSGVRVKAKGFTDQVPARKYRSSFSSFQGFHDLADTLKALDEPSVGPQPPFDAPVTP